MLKVSARHAPVLRLPRRFYAQKTRVVIGPRLKNLDEIKEYLGKPTWSVEKYLQSSSNGETQPPSRETVEKLLKLSGLPNENVEMFQATLGKQLAFINKVQSLPVDESLDPSHARIIDRNSEALDYESLSCSVEQQETEKDSKMGEVGGSWDGTGLAAISENGFYVLREGLLKNRK
ncbi:glutamyl-tRNA(Gln) amidotransferase subunit F [Lachancea thermotolerans CBS 6340]|uniref:Glutamyl-tRNA(Gln) amidotransferase subunit F, mitochondrial n=1 Tax=Lachancea thermotolerans (strain ATCC 56472 / CBS 6340 / NRRL Y-8284) TaxID=559295 RepID=GATF_LACTC|nr:KLTH0E05368p [Lachancea thermotolerans CBS 6340]C5DHL6.1 RecName: Full=Glutamyl-tRNA(Gln) amidotransferase subunit F, mitochondrial; Short=Glu-AdT subunit F; Flags: Precursor [Lachancea thermotolerans CBS 6340]CAR23277.1 KLTH0E05368p [Lachancea thermotolerans CBS 6340]